MTQATVDVSKLGLGSVEVDHSFGMRRKAGELNKDISQIQLDAQRKFSGATRDISALQKPDKSKSEDERMLERLEDKCRIGPGSIDPDYWDVRVESAALAVNPEINQATSTAGTELKITEKYLIFIENLAGVNTKVRKQKFENGDLSIGAIAEITKKSAFTISDIKRDSETFESNKESGSMGNKQILVRMR